MGKLTKFEKRSRLLAAGHRDINALGLSVAERTAAETECRRVAEGRGPSWQPCVERGHCCVRCETIGRSALEADK